MTAVFAAQQVLCRWCRAPAQHLRDAVQCRACAAIGGCAR